MKRRSFLGACSACSAMLLPGVVRAQEWAAPARFTRPDAATDEGGLWALMDREETRLRRSPFNLRDPELRAYVQDITCRLAGEHCPDVRVHLVRTPYFNASMAPNGMMQVWSGLMLRVDNEAQLAAVLGHEIGHYLARHSIERLRDAKSMAAAAHVAALFGLVGAIAQLGMAASQMAYSRDHERDADRIGGILMHKAGFDVSEASKVWSNLLMETKARPGGSQESVLFATHPAAEERAATLAEAARTYPGGQTGEKLWQQKTAPFLREWLADEVRRGQHEESLALLTRALERGTQRSEYLYARGEVYRLRGKDEDLEASLKDFTAAAAAGGEPPQTHRGLGLVHRARKSAPEAKASFQRYLELDPQAPDAAMIKTYLEELT